MSVLCVSYGVGVGHRMLAKCRLGVNVQGSGQRYNREQHVADLSFCSGSLVR